MVILTFAILSVLAAAHTDAIHTSEQSAASHAQIKFAIENEYDQTGPGAKQPEYAYKTFKNLEEALLSYVDDKDTKLPEREKFLAYSQLLDKEHTTSESPLKSSILINRYTFNDNNAFYHDPKSRVGILDLRNFGQIKPKTVSPIKLKKIDFVKPRPLSVPHFSTDIEQIKENKFHTRPQYTYSYGVHDRHTGDSKTAHETRDGGSVTGYYTVMDADGKQRTVHYTADDKQGFRAVVHRTPSNGHLPS